MPSSWWTLVPNATARVNQSVFGFTAVEDDEVADDDGAAADDDEAADDAEDDAVFAILEFESLERTAPLDLALLVGAELGLSFRRRIVALGTVDGCLAFGPKLSSSRAAIIANRFLGSIVFSYFFFFFRSKF